MEDASVKLIILNQMFKHVGSVIILVTLASQAPEPKMNVWLVLLTIFQIELTFQRQLRSVRAIQDMPI
jgi:aryl carrier-like protein